MSDKRFEAAEEDLKAAERLAVVGEVYPWLCRLTSCVGHLLAALGEQPELESTDESPDMVAELKEFIDGVQVVEGDWKDSRVTRVKRYVATLRDLERRASELAEVRRQHQQTIEERDRFSVEITKGRDRYDRLERAAKETLKTLVILSIPEDSGTAKVLARHRRELDAALSPQEAGA